MKALMRCLGAGCWIAISAALLIVVGTQNAISQTTAFTYQGHLTLNGSSASGTHELRFTLFDAPTGGTELAGPLTVTTALAGDGTFSVTLDFGAAVFNGADRWLHIAVRRANSGGAFQELSPRQPILTVPYAIRATTAGAVSTTTETPLEFFANNERVFRLESHLKGPNVIGGFSGNTANGSVGATIAGGGTIGAFNRVATAFGTVGGGIDNAVGGTRGVVAGGQANTANADYSFIGGGLKNTIEPVDVFETNGFFAVIAGGSQNTNRGSSAFIAGGQLNKADGAFSTVAGGLRNSAGGELSLAAGHRAKANHDGAFVWADSTDADFASSGNNQFLVRAAGGVGIGTTNPINRLTIAGSGGFSSLGAAAITLDNTSATGRRWEWHALNDGRMQFADVDASASRLLIDTNGNVGIGVGPASKLHVNGDVRIGTFSIVAQSGLAPAANSTLAPTTGYVVLTPTANVTLNTTTAIANGTAAGQMLILQGDGAFTVTIPDNANTRMGGAAVLGNNDVLTLLWNGNDWVQISFSDN